MKKKNQLKHVRSGQLVFVLFDGRFEITFSSLSLSSLASSPMMFVVAVVVVAAVAAPTVDAHKHAAMLVTTETSDEMRMLAP